MKNLQIYLVGGAVRDLVMGIIPKDMDYVVVGSSPEEMEALGYQQVGADFPVFLHPETGDEFALARIDRKTGTGYLGFTCDASNSVTLEQDLSRRDLTMNAMALPYREDGNYDVNDIIDPFGGIADINGRYCRHVSDSFREDPVRILRVARFAARYNFYIAPETSELLKEMVTAGEFDHLEPARVWKEIEKGLMEDTPRPMFVILRNCGALARIPHFKGGFRGQGLYQADLIEDKQWLPLRIRFAVIATEFGTDPKVYNDARVPTECRDLAIISILHLPSVWNYPSMTAQQKVEVLTKTSGIGSKRNTTMFDDFLLVMQMRCNYEADAPPNWIDHLDQMDRDRTILKSVELAPIVAQANSDGIPIKTAVLQHLIKTLNQPH